MAIENHASVPELVRQTLDTPEAASEALPVLVEALDHEDPVVRVGVGWAICAVAAENPEDAPAVLRRLETSHGHTAELAAGWIRRETGANQSAGSAEASRPPSEESGERTDGDTDEDPDGVRQEVGPSQRPAPGDDPAEKSDDDRSTQSSTDRAPEPERTDEVVRNGQFTIPLDRTVFDSLEIVEQVAADRHSWTYAGIASVNARRTAVLVRTYRAPLGARHSTFAGAFETVAAEWDGVDDHENVLTVHDYGRRPHPWVVTAYSPRTLRSVGRLPVEPALRIGLHASKGLGHAHERGITHGSLDPRSVALDSEDGRPVARLANLGIVEAFRVADGPLPLDSRYAAPELFDDEHGPVDWLTDVYHLGAVLYTAFTGRPPYGQSLVGRGGPAGLSYDPPSAVVDDLPVAADRIVAKAMATHKIARYESADEFARDLQSALAEVEDGT